MIFLPHVRMAVQNLRSNKVRTFLTLLGIIIGVMSVTTIIGLGEGVKDQVNQQIEELGGDLITVTPGTLATEGGLSVSNLLRSGGSTSALSEKDLESLSKIENVKLTSGVMRLNGSVTRGSTKLNSSNVLSVDENYLTVTSQKIVKGQFFGGGLENNQTAVLASEMAQKLFGEEDPIGSRITVRGIDFVVVGVLDANQGFNFGQPLNDHVLIPLPAGKEMNQDVIQLQQISLQLQDVEAASQTAQQARLQLASNRDGEEDFTVTTQDQLSDTTNEVFRVLTSFTAAVASISLVVGGIGVMNIMLVTVTERTREIGIRKAIGATRLQILMQFLTEALIITLSGGIIGILLSVLLGFIIRAQTAVQPALDLWIILLAAIVSLLVGVIFGTWPAVRAARKDPIEALRHD